MKNYKIRFLAEDLCDKFGFSDGDLLSNRQVLEAAVRKYLIPMLDPSVIIHVFGSCHNPIRVTKETEDLIDKSISIDVPVSELISLGHDPQFDDELGSNRRIPNPGTD